MSTQEIDLTVGGMTCDHCVHHVTEALRGLDGVADASVSLDTTSARVTLDGTVAPEAIKAAAKAAVAEVGYEILS